MSERPESKGAPGKGPLVVAGIVLAVAIVVPLLVSTYARMDPELFGVPFFFWYQFLWVFLCSGLTWTAYLLTRSARRGGRR